MIPLVQLHSGPARKYDLFEWRNSVLRMALDPLLLRRSQRPPLQCSITMNDMKFSSIEAPNKASTVTTYEWRPSVTPYPPANPRISNHCTPTNGDAANDAYDGCSTLPEGNF